MSGYGVPRATNGSRPPDVVEDTLMAFDDDQSLPHSATRAMRAAAAPSQDADRSDHTFLKVALTAVIVTGLLFTLVASVSIAEQRDQARADACSLGTFEYCEADS